MKKEELLKLTEKYRTAIQRQVKVAQAAKKEKKE